MDDENVPTFCGTCKSYIGLKPKFNESWRERFEKKFEIPWHEETGYNLKNIKSFISSELALAKQEERERILGEYGHFTNSCECFGGTTLKEALSDAKNIINERKTI